MDAYRQFKQLLNQIEDSKLNYVISKTPFSANISVKASFVQFHIVVDSEKEVNVKEEVKTDKSVEANSKLVNISKQNDLLKQEQSRVKVMKCEVENLRGKLAEVKKEKDAAKLERKSDKNVLNDLQKKVSELAQSNKDLEDDVNVKLKLKMLHARSLRASNKHLKPN